MQLLENAYFWGSNDFKLGYSMAFSDGHLLLTKSNNLN